MSPMRARLPWVLLGLTVVLALVMLALSLGQEALSDTVLYGLAALSLGATGAFVASRQPANPIGWIFCGLGGSSKTAAGIARDVPMQRMLFDAVSECWTRHPNERPEALLFATATGRTRDRNNIRNRVLNPSIKRAEALLSERKSGDSFPTRERADGALARRAKDRDHLVGGQFMGTGAIAQ